MNAKVYAESTGPAAVALGRALEAAAQGAGADVALAVGPLELAAVCAAVRIPVYAQHVDAARPGAATGHVTVEAAKAAGAKGSLLNHAERKIAREEVARGVGRLREAGLSSLVCATDAADAASLAAFHPDLLAVEPPALIGGDVSVTTADPRVVSDAVAAVKRVAPATRVLCGAGVKNADDLRAALRLGADGVLLASGVVKAKDPGAALAALLAGAR